MKTNVCKIALMFLIGTALLYLWEIHPGSRLFDVHLLL